MAKRKPVKKSGKRGKGVGSGVKPGTKRGPYKKTKEPEIKDPAVIEAQAKIEDAGPDDSEALSKFIDDNQAHGAKSASDREPAPDGVDQEVKADVEGAESAGVVPDEKGAAGSEQGAVDPSLDQKEGVKEESPSQGDKVEDDDDYQVSTELLDKKAERYEQDAADGDLLFTLMDFAQAPIAKGMISAMSKKERREFYKALDVERIYLTDPQKQNILKDPRTAEEVDKIFGGMHPLLKALVKGHVFYLHNAKLEAKREREK